MSWPAYLDLYASGELRRRVGEAVAALASCRICPRDCGVDRLRDQRMACKVGRRARVSTHFAHFGEEDCLRGWNGSGTIFFSFCNLRCVFCQNWETSQEGEGEELDARCRRAPAVHASFRPSPGYRRKKWPFGSE